MPTLKINVLHFTLIGDFNPIIFQPAWFSAEKLISEAEAMEAAKATDTVVASQITNFKIPWAAFNISREAFNASTAQESHFEPLRDLVAGTFKLLKHTPVRKMGINIEQHYLYENMDEWNDFGHKLAPKDIWKNFMGDPGLLSMTMTDKAPRKSPPGLTRVDIQGSNRVKPGIYFGVNNHYEWDSAPTTGASEAVKIIESNYHKALEVSQSIIETLINKK